MKKIFSVFFALVLVLTLGLVTAGPVAAADPSGTFTVANGTYTTVKVDNQNGTISATLNGSWAPSDVLGDFTATGIGLLYIQGMYPANGTTANINISGTLSAGQITFSGTALRTAGDDITEDSVTGITGTLIIQTDGSFVAALTGTVDGPYTVDIDMTTGVLLLTGTGGSETEGEVPGVTLVTPATGEVNTTPTVIITGGGFTTDGEATAVSFGAGITVDSFTVDSNTQISADLTIAADADAGLRDVVVTIPGPETLTGTGLFEVLESLTLTAPSNINLGLMIPGETASGQSLADGTVVTNVATWAVDAADAKVLETGYMNTVADGSGTSLAALFQISNNGTEWMTADVGIIYTDAYVLPFYVEQIVDPADPVGSYSITITFIATIL